MFERFTHEARTVVVHALEIARDRGDASIGSHHLLLAAVTAPVPVAATLTQHGLDPETVTARIATAGGPDDIDPVALRAVGIDLDEIRRRVEESFGPGALDEPIAEAPITDEPRRRGRWRRGGGHIPFTADAKESLVQSLQEALRLGHREINSAHIVLGILACGSGAGGRLLVRAATPALRVDLEIAARPAA